MVNPFYVSAGISAVSSLLGMRASTKGIEAQLANVEWSIGEAKNDYIRQLASTYEQEALITQETREMLSTRGLEAMKAEGRLRAGVSGTGLVGSSMEEIKQQSKYDQIFDNAVIIARSRKSKTDLSRERMSQYIAFKNRTQGYASSIPKPADTGIGSALMAGLTTGLSAFSTGVLMGGTTNDLFKSNTSVTNNSMSSESFNQVINRQSIQPSIFDVQYRSYQ